MQKLIEGISNFIEGFGNFFKAVFEFVIDFIEDSLYIIEICGKAVLAIPDLFGWLPTSIVALIVGIFAVVVIYKLLGREG